MAYINKVCSLAEMSSTQVAINLCQQNSFKEIALLLKKPSYDIFHRYNTFVSDPEKLSIWAKIDIEKDLWPYFDFEKSRCLSDAEKVRLWDAAIEDHCEKLLEGISDPLRKGVHIWIIRIALEYMSYSRRQESLFGLSRNFLLDFLTPEDWTKSGRLDEKKLTLQVLQDERLTILQRYRIACAYCLYTHIPQLRAGLTQEEKQSTSGENKGDLSKETHDLVLFWSRHMDRKEEGNEESQTNQLWTEAIRKATLYGNRTAVMLCWERLEKHAQQLIIFDMALLSLKCVRKLHAYGIDNKERLVSNSLRTGQCDVKIIEHFNLPCYHSELMCFFMSQMDEEQQLTFFKRAFQSGYTDRIVECFLDWPHQNDFLPTINRLWGVIPKNKYVQCLLTLVSKYSGKGNRGNYYYDYRSLFKRLWEETPDEYKQYLLGKNESYDAQCLGYDLLTRVLDRSPFKENDEDLFKLVFHDLSQEQRRYLIDLHSQTKEKICSLLMQKENWSFVNWLLEASLPSDEIPNFKKELIQSDICLGLCLNEYNQNRESLVKDLADWGFVSDIDKRKFKCTLRKLRSDAHKPHLCKGDCAKMKCIWYRMKRLFESAFEWNEPMQHKPLHIRTGVVPSSKTPSF